MEKNVGGLDKAIRLVAGVALVAVGLFVSMGAGLRVAVFFVAAVALFTGIFGF
jgi:hypothetical protein